MKIIGIGTFTGMFTEGINTIMAEKVEFNSNSPLANGLNVMVVDDEEDIVDLIKYNLEEEGFRVTTCKNGMEVMPRIDKHKPDLIILDVMLPGVGGIDLCHKIKDKYTVPIIMVTAKTGETDAVLGLEFGADDYVRKPFSPRELMARVKSVLRRYTNPVDEEKAGSITIGKVHLNSKAHRVTVDDKEVDLTLLEYKILYLFMSNPGVALSRDKLLDKIWGNDIFVTDRAVDVNIKRLRDKLGIEKNRLETIRGIGYRFSNA